MSAQINERVPGTGTDQDKTKIASAVALVPAHVRDFLNLRRLPARLTVQQTAGLLNCGEHDIPVLVGAGLLKELGHPQPNAVKYFAPTDVLELAGDSERMGQISDSIREYWRHKNAAKSNGTYRKSSPAMNMTRGMKEKRSRYT